MKMNTRWIGFYTAILLTIAPAIAGAAPAKQDNNPSQAGKSSIYFYDVAPNGAHGNGKLMIDLDKHTFVFNGQDFTPSAHISLRAQAAGSTEYVRFASGKATPSGNLHIAGTWDAAAAPAAVAWYQQIFGMWLHNDGGFIAKIACYYSTDSGATWHESDASDNILYNEQDLAPLWRLNVPEYSLVKIHVVVVWGNDKTGSEVFESASSSIYGSGDPEYAYYLIEGTTLNASLYFQGILTWSD